MKLEELSLEQLKVMAYDTLNRLQVEQSNLQLLNQMIQKKQNPQTIPPIITKVDKKTADKFKENKLKEEKHGRNN